MITPVVKWLLIINGLVFFLELRFAEPLIGLFALWPLVPHGLMTELPYSFQLWQLLSYSFLHGSLLHIGFNMYALWLFGIRLETLWGSQRFLYYYFVCVAGAGLVQLLVSSWSARYGTVFPTIGASGGVFGILLAFGLTFPEERLALLFPPVILKAKWFVLLYGAIELWAGITGTQAGVAHFAHLGGMLFGFLLLHRWRHQ